MFLPEPGEDLCVRLTRCLSETYWKPHYSVWISCFVSLRPHVKKKMFFSVTWWSLCSAARCRANSSAPVLSVYQGYVIIFSLCCLLPFKHSTWFTFLHYVLLNLLIVDQLPALTIL